LNARSNSFGSLLVPISRAVSRIRLRRSSSESVCFFLGIIVDQISLKSLNCALEAFYVLFQLFFPTRGYVFPDSVHVGFTHPSSGIQLRDLFAKLANFLPKKVDAALYDLGLRCHLSYTQSSSNERMSRSLVRPLRKSRSAFLPTSRSIGQPLSDCPFERLGRAAFVADSKRLAVRIAEIEFVQIPLQMLHAAMLVGSDHAALKEAEGAFNGVGRNFAARIRLYCDSRCRG